tara:strand:- start:12078 stop:12524 length:447 start_codon:yes stop_codon:yes gene_type:complete
MFTRTKDTNEKIQYDLNLLTKSNNYTFGKPGNGTAPPFIEDTHIRLQQWGANKRQNITEIEHDLFGQTRKLNRDTPETEYLKNAYKSTAPTYKTDSIKNDHTKIRDNFYDDREVSLQNPRTHILNEDPQKNIRYLNPKSTRYDEKYNS